MEEGTFTDKKGCVYTVIREDYVCGEYQEVEFSLDFYRKFFLMEVGNYDLDKNFLGGHTELYVCERIMNADIYRDDIINGIIEDLRFP